MKKLLFIFLSLLCCTISVRSQSTKFPNAMYTAQKFNIDTLFKTDLKAVNYNGIIYKYKVKEFTVGGKTMINAIQNKEISKIKELISDGYDLTLPVFLTDFSDFTTDPNFFSSNNFGFTLIGGWQGLWKAGGKIDVTNFFAKRYEDDIYTSAIPTPAVKTTPLETAQNTNDMEIISIISIELEKQQSQKKMNDSLRYIKLLVFKDSLSKLGYKVICPGEGFDSIKIGVSSFEDIVSKLGNNYEKTNHKKYSTEIYYKEMGVKFYFYYKNMDKIFAIHIQNPFKGITSDGIELNKSTMGDIIKLYGRGAYNYGNNNQGIEIRNKKVGIAFYRKDEVVENLLEAKVIDIEIFEKSNK